MQVAFSHIDSPEVRSCLEQLRTNYDGDSGYLLTMVSLLQFYHKNMKNDPDLSVKKKGLRERLLAAGTVFIGPMYSLKRKDATSRAQKLHQLKVAGYKTNHLVFLNPVQVDLFFSYVKETGLVFE